MDEVTFRIFRGEPDADGEPFGQMIDYTVTLDEGMVVLDVIHRIQAEQAPDCHAAGTARRASAAHAALRSTASRS